MKTKYKILWAWLLLSTLVLWFEQGVGFISEAGAEGALGGMWAGVLVWIFLLKEGEGYDD